MLWNFKIRSINKRKNPLDLIQNFFIEHIDLLLCMHWRLQDNCDVIYLLNTYPLYHFNMLCIYCVLNYLNFLMFGKHDTMMYFLLYCISLVISVIWCKLLSKLDDVFYYTLYNLLSLILQILIKPVPFIFPLTLKNSTKILVRIK